MGIQHRLLHFTFLESSPAWMVSCAAFCAVDAVEPPWVDADHPLSHIEEALRHGSACQLCSTFARMPLVTPCAHLLCVDCAAPHRQALLLPVCTFRK